MQQENKTERNFIEMPYPQDIDSWFCKWTYHCVIHLGVVRSRGFLRVGEHGSTRDTVGIFLPRSRTIRGEKIERMARR